MKDIVQALVHGQLAVEELFFRKAIIECDKCNQGKVGQLEQQASQGLTNLVGLAMCRANIQSTKEMAVAIPIKFMTLGEEEVLAEQR